MSVCLCSTCGLEVSHGAFVYYEGMCFKCRKEADELAYRESLERVGQAGARIKELRENLVLHVMMGGTPSEFVQNA